MKQYLLSVYQPDGPVPEPAVLEPIMKNLATWNDELRDAGSWVFSAGLHPPESATVLRASASGPAPGSGSASGSAAASASASGSTSGPASGSDEVLVTDGPFTEGKEHLGGFTVIEVEDLDEALRWGRKLAVIVAPLPIEVRPFA